MSPVLTTQHTRQIITIKAYLSLLYAVMMLNVCHKCDPGLNDCQCTYIKMRLILKI